MKTKKGKNESTLVIKNCYTVINIFKSKVLTSYVKERFTFLKIDRTPINFTIITN
jgi:hypothetical protein